MLRGGLNSWRAAWALLQADIRTPCAQQAFANVQFQLQATSAVQRAPASFNSMLQFRMLSSKDGPGSSSLPHDAVDKMVDMMLRNKSLQQMMMASLPPHMRSPEALQALFNNPATRAQIVEMISKQGAGLPPEVLQRISNTSDIEQSLQKAEQMGIDPGEVFKKLLQYPGLMQKFQDPRVVRAFLDISRNPDNLEKYRDQPDIIEVYLKAKEVLLPKIDQPSSDPPQADAAISLPPSSPTEASTTHTSTEATTEAVAQPEASNSMPSAAFLGSSAAGLGLGSDEMLQRLLANPKAVEALSKPRVQQALQEAAGSKWKLMKYMFDPEVRAALKELESIVGPSSQKK